MVFTGDSVYSGDSRGRGGSVVSSSSSIAYYRFPTGAFTIPGHATTSEGRVITANGDIQEHDPSDEIDHSGSSILLGIGAWEVQYSFNTEIAAADQGAGRRQQVNVWVQDEDNDKALGTNYRQYIRGDDVDLGIHGTITIYLETPTHINLRMVSIEPQNTDYKTVPVNTGFVTIIKHGGVRGVKGAHGDKGDDATPYNDTAVKNRLANAEEILTDTNLNAIGSADVGNYLQATASGEADWRPVSGASGGGSPAIFRHNFVNAQTIIPSNVKSLEGATVQSYSGLDDLSRNADGQIDLVTRTFGSKDYKGWSMKSGVYDAKLSLRLTNAQLARIRSIDIIAYTRTSGGSENTVYLVRDVLISGGGLSGSLALNLTTDDVVYFSIRHNLVNTDNDVSTNTQISSGEIAITRIDGIKGEKGDDGGNTYDDTEVKRDIDTNQTAISTLQTTVSGLSNYDDTAVRDLITRNSDSVSDLRTALAGKASVSESNSFPSSPETHDVVVIKTALTGLSGVFDIDYTAITTAAKYDVFQWDGFRWVQLGSLNPVSSGGGGSSYDDSALVQRTDNIERALRILNFSQGEVIYNANNAADPAGNIVLNNFVLSRATGTSTYKDTNFGDDVVNRFFEIAPPGLNFIRFYIDDVNSLRSHIGESFILRNITSQHRLVTINFQAAISAFPTNAGDGSGGLYQQVLDNQSSLTYNGQFLNLPDETSVLFTIKEIDDTDFASPPPGSGTFQGKIVFTASDIPQIQEYVFDNMDLVRTLSNAIVVNERLNDLNFTPQVLSKASFPSQLAFNLSFRFNAPMTTAHYAQIGLRGESTNRVQLANNPTAIRLTMSTSDTGTLLRSLPTNSSEECELEFYTAASGGNPILTRRFRIWVGA